ncbi:MAG TPA: hypothetical protein VF552_05025 [Allosphingosinicella sp.]|jgi:hypothetical protein
MKKITLLAIPAALAGCHAAPEGPAAAASQPPQAAPAACALEIEFGSYAMGIDRTALARVEQLLAGDGAVTSVTRRNWGREGEITLCVSVRGAADRDRLFTAVSALFPARPHGPLSVTTDTGRVFRANNDNP